MNSKRFIARFALACASVLLASFPNTAQAEVVFRRIVLTGEQAPGTPAGAFFSQLGGLAGFGDDFPPRIDAQGNVAFHAVLEGTGVTGVSLADGNGLGVWKQVGGVLSLVARQDDPAPGTEAGVEFRGFTTGLVPQAPSITGGLAVFPGELRGPGVDDQFFPNANGVWRETPFGVERAVRNGDPAPGLAAGHTLRAMNEPAVGPGGRIMFNGVYSKPGDPPGALVENQEGFWTDRSGALEALALGAQQVPGLAAGVVFGEVDFTAIEGAFRSWGANDALKLVFNGNLKGPGIDAFNDEGIWIEQNGALTLLVREGDPSPAVGPGVRFGINNGIDTFGEIVPLMMNGPGAILFGARHRGESIPFTRGLWTTRHGSLELIAYGTAPLTGSAPGSPAPGMGPGATFSAIVLAQLNDANQVAFSGAVTIDMNFDNQVQGVWWDRPGALTLVARADDPAPGLPGLEFAGFNRTLSFGGGGHLAFLADLRDAASGEGRGAALMMTDPEGALHVLVRTGVPFDVAGDGTDLRVVTLIRPGLVNAAGEVPLELEFLDGSAGLFVARIAPVLGVVPPGRSPLNVSLATPRPNPRAGAAAIALRFDLDRPATVRFAVHDLAGRVIAVREPEHFEAAGGHTVRWNPGRLAPGVYVVRLVSDAGPSAATRWVVLE